MLIDGYKDVRELPYGYLDKLHIYKLRYVVSKNDFAPQKDFLRSKRFDERFD
ncbi:MAG: hypothetical protein V9G25_02305 [Acidimicrobiia bacterium]